MDEVKQTVNVFELPQEDRDKLLAHADYLISYGYLSGDLLQLANTLATIKEKKCQHT